MIASKCLPGVFPDQLDGMTYINCGDWVDSYAAVVEHHDHRMDLVDWGHAGASPASGGWWP